MWQLPGCWEQPLWQLLPQAIQHKMASNDSNKAEAVTEPLLYVCDRDLEAVWTDSSSVRRDLLMNLPADVLTAFLKSPELRVISEDTVLYTVARRIEAMDKARPGLNAAAAKQQQELLVSAVRLPQLTPNTLCFVAPLLPWLSPSQLRLASFLQQCTVSSTVAAKRAVPAEWQQQRSKSACTQHIMRFEVDLAQLQAACNNALQDEDTPSIRTHVVDAAAFGGRDWELKWSFKCHKGKEGAVDMGVFISGAFPGLPGKNRALVRKGGITFKCGPIESTVSACASGGIYSINYGCGSLICSTSSPEAWANPVWAQDGKVTVTVTLQAECCL